MILAYVLAIAGILAVMFGHDLSSYLLLITGGALITGGLLAARGSR